MHFFEISQHITCRLVLKGVLTFKSLGFYFNSWIWKGLHLHETLLTLTKTSTKYYYIRRKLNTNASPMIMQEKNSNAHPDLARDLNFYPIVNEIPKTLSNKQIQCYNEKGYIFPIDVFSETEISRHRKHFDKIINTEIQNGRGGYSINGRHRHDPHIYDLIINSRILDCV